jgi:hypothetical protein
MSRQSQTTSDWLLGAVKQNPEGLLLLAAGCALLLRSTPAFGRSPSATSSQPTSDRRNSEAGTGAADRVRNYASEVADQTRQTASAYASSAAEFASDVRGSVEETSERIVHQAQSTLQNTMNRVLQEQPLMVALAGVAAGAALAALLPPSDMEKKTLGPVGEQVAEAAHRVGEQVSVATERAGENSKTSPTNGACQPKG